MKIRKATMEKICQIFFIYFLDKRKEDKTRGENNLEGVVILHSWNN